MKLVVALFALFYVAVANGNPQVVDLAVRTLLLIPLEGSIITYGPPGGSASFHPLTLRLFLLLDANSSISSLRCFSPPVRC
jgi:hypothetical protein